jgi:hypothetical protein
MQVESFLTGKSFSIDRNINAQAMDTHGEKVRRLRRTSWTPN